MTMAILYVVTVIKPAPGSRRISFPMSPWERYPHKEIIGKRKEQEVWHETV